jgi:hypothetical protein
MPDTAIETSAMATPGTGCGYWARRCRAISLADALDQCSAASGHINIAAGVSSIATMYPVSIYHSKVTGSQERSAKNVDQQMEAGTHMLHLDTVTLIQHALLILQSVVGNGI